MKISALFLLSGSASAFTPATTKASVSALHMTDNPIVTEEQENSEKSLPTMSASMPFMARPAMLNGALAGDVGFDPLGFAKTKEELIYFREAEIKHCRLAMLAAAGWPLSELWDKKLAALFDLSAVVDAGDRVPSVLNGGLGKVSPAYWLACALLAGAIDVYGISRARDNAPDYFPGNLGFDPFNLYPEDADAQMDMQVRELKNGRLAMIAISAFAVQEFVSKIGIVDEVPIFFKPIGLVLHEYSNSGYIN